MGRRFFEPRASRIINLGWEHGRYADYWSALHFLSGLLFGMLGLLLGFSLMTAFLAAAVIEIVYECVEVAFGVSEDIQNVLTDIVLVVIGPPIVFSVFPLSTTPRPVLILVTLAIALLEVFLFRKGWGGYLKKALKKK